MEMFTEEDDILIAQEYESLLLQSRKRGLSEEQYNLVQKAFEFANEAHRNVRRRSGVPYIIHPISVAKIVVSEIGLGCKSICAALLHDVVEDTEYTVEDIRNYFGDRIAILVDGLTKIKSALDKDKKSESSLQAENFKRILLTLNDDARIVLIKMADRLHNLRTIEFMPEYKSEKVLSETMYIFIPLAHRLGLYNIKTEMENIWLQRKEPEIYRDLETRLQGLMESKANVIDNFVTPVEAMLKNQGLDFRITRRIKSPYSIWKKMESKHLPFEEIFDLFAVRIIFTPNSNISEREQCWQIFSRITGMFKYKPERTRDWVSEPKMNGYESLHTTVMVSGTWIEVQIRSERMNDVAERGVAAHWAYKKGDTSTQTDRNLDLWLQHVHDILENPDANALQLLDEIHKELLISEIYVFTPKGESKCMHKGSTALDFAYYIHTKVGNHAIAAKVNMKLVPLSHTLSNGDQVEIITSNSATPKREWLDFLKTTRAKNQVIATLKDDKKDNMQIGLKLLEQELEKRNIKMQSRVIRKLVGHYNIAGGKDELYYKIGLGLITLDNLDTILKTNVSQRDVQMWGFKVLTPDKVQGTINKKEDYILKEDITNGKISFKTDNCCHPIPGDNVVGVINEDNSVTIHKTSCPVFTSFAATNGHRIISVKWSKHFIMSYLARITLSGIDRIGLLNDISHAITLELGVNIRKVMIESHDEIFEGYIDLYIHNTEDLESLMESIRKIKGVESVLRTDIS
ncbi:MAG: bifunctional (p)ppGpp synthetase/guanosine-3',5'-bis(diphosphate) 3'-pyrophosphohydrolase [Bacteroidales bacterium]|nr:bifunctional (p)ppGpp synthetase/guanosine-3',5'-bis(diphosphate) 3'-pyrophosphohydrolase [Bacteroidales bacterium]